MRRTFCWLLAVALVAALSLPAQAAYVSGGVGNSDYANGTTATGLTGYVNFAVYSNPNPGADSWLAGAVNGSLTVPTASIPPGDPLSASPMGPMGGTVTGAERTVVFFEVVNTSELYLVTNFSVPNPVDPTDAGKHVWLGGGVLKQTSTNIDLLNKGTVFVTNGGSGSDVVAPGFAGVQTLGTAASGGTTSTDGLAPGYNNTIVDPGENAAVRDAELPASLTALDSDGNATFTWGAGTGTGLNVETHSAVMFLVSDLAEFEFQTGDLDAVATGLGDLTASFGAPTPTPEPGSLLLLSLAFAGGAVGARWKRRRKRNENPAPSDAES